MLIAASFASPLVAVRDLAVAQIARLPGIDVSRWQGAIDWTQVAGSGVRFAIAKATEGRTYVDPNYLTNKAGAQAAGIAFTAYHFAQPDDTPGDAVAEADHFVDTAQLAAGNLIPALDLERTNGLSQAQITQWVLAWLGRVTERLGVRPMVYTSPNGWENRTGDTTAVVQSGYDVVWVAHWSVDVPRVPAWDWGGRGWTFWQFTSDGIVPGIQGRVDLDWFDGSSLDAVTLTATPIPTPVPTPTTAPPPSDATPPVASIAAPTALTDPVTVTFDERVRNVTETNVALLGADDGAPVAVELTCRSRTSDVDCLGGRVRTIAATPRSPLLAGQSYTVVVNPVGASPTIEDRSGNVVATAQHPFRAATRVEQDDGAVGYAWRAAANRRAFGGSFAVERLAGATATFAFSGRSVTWYTAEGPAQGKAAVWIDGRRIRTFDQYAPKPAFRRTRTFDGLERGPHTITVEVLGTRSHRAQDTQVVVDGFGVGDDVVRTPALTERWRSAEAAEASGGTVAAADLARSSATFAFRGPAVQWFTVRGPRQGRAAIYVDDVLVRTVDNYASETTFGIARTIDGLSDAPHTLRIVALGTSRPAALGALVAVDRFVVGDAAG